MRVRLAICSVLVLVLHIDTMSFWQGSGCSDSSIRAKLQLPQLPDVMMCAAISIDVLYPATRILNAAAYPAAVSVFSSPLPSTRL